jgi:uncharacterized damage-inducible protein DinB
MTDGAHAVANAAATERLRALAATLSEDDLGADLGEGWTVSMALAHLAFWDRWHLARWEHALAEGAVAPVALPDEVSDRANEALEPIWRALAPGRAVALALGAAEAVDARVARLPDASLEAARERGGARWVERSPHRTDHVEQIRRALGRD